MTEVGLTKQLRERVARPRRYLAPWPTPTQCSREWSLHYALVAYVASWVMAFAGMLLVRDLLGVRVSSEGRALLYDAILLSTLAPLYRTGLLRARDIGLRQTHGARSVGLVVLAFLLVGWMVFLLRVVVHPGPRPPETLFSNISHQGFVLIVLAVFAATVSAPVVEEVFFRGLLYRSLRNRLTLVPASLIAGVLFGMVHTEYPLGVRATATFFGIAACLLYERTGSLFPGIAMHSFINASAFDVALTGNDRVVLSVFGLFAVVLVIRPCVKSLVRILRSQPVFGTYTSAPPALDRTELDGELDSGRERGVATI